MNEISTLDELIRRIVGDTVRDVVRSELAMLADAKLRNVVTVADSYLSVTKAARVADVAPGTIRAWIRAGRLGSKRAGRVLRVSREELERFMSGTLTDAQVVEIKQRAKRQLGSARKPLHQKAA